MILVEQPAPVFVDSTGRRRRLLRRFSYAFGGFCVVYGGLISVSLAGGPVSPDAVLPFPDLITGTQRTPADVRPTGSTRPGTASPKAVLVNEALPRREEDRGWRGRATAGERQTSRPTRRTRPSASASPTPRATGSTPRPTEAATTGGSASVRTPQQTSPPTTPSPVLTTSTPSPRAGGNAGGGGSGVGAGPSAAGGR